MSKQGASRPHTALFNRVIYARTLRGKILQIAVDVRTVTYEELYRKFAKEMGFTVPEIAILYMGDTLQKTEEPVPAFELESMSGEIIAVVSAPRNKLDHTYEIYARLLHGQENIKVNPKNVTYQELYQKFADKMGSAPEFLVLFYEGDKLPRTGRVNPSLVPMLSSRMYLVVSPVPQGEGPRSTTTKRATTTGGEDQGESAGVATETDVDTEKLHPHEVSAIMINNRTAVSIFVDNPETATYEELRQKIAEKMRITPEMLRLMYAGYVLPETGRVPVASDDDTLRHISGQMHAVRRIPDLDTSTTGSSKTLEHIKAEKKLKFDNDTIGILEEQLEVADSVAEKEVISRKIQKAAVVADRARAALEAEEVLKNARDRYNATAVAASKSDHLVEDAEDAEDVEMELKKAQSLYEHLISERERRHGAEQPRAVPVPPSGTNFVFYARTLLKPLIQIVVDSRTVTTDELYRKIADKMEVAPEMVILLYGGNTLPRNAAHVPLTVLQNLSRQVTAVSDLSSGSGRRTSPTKKSSSSPSSPKDPKMKMAPPTSSPLCSTDKIPNPASGRCVLKTGAIGKLILSRQQEHTEWRSRSSSADPELPSPSERQPGRRRGGRGNFHSDGDGDGEGEGDRDEGGRHGAVNVYTAQIMWNLQVYDPAEMKGKKKLSASEFNANIAAWYNKYGRQAADRIIPGLLEIAFKPVTGHTDRISVSAKTSRPINFSTYVDEIADCDLEGTYPVNPLSGRPLQVTDRNYALIMGAVAAEPGTSHTSPLSPLSPPPPPPPPRQPRQPRQPRSGTNSGKKESRRRVRNSDQKK